MTAPTPQEATPPADYVPAPWVRQFTRTELQWLAERLQDRQHKARMDYLQARTESTAAQARLAVLEAQKETR